MGITAGIGSGLGFVFLLDTSYIKNVVFGVFRRTVFVTPNSKSAENASFIGRLK